MTQFRKLKCSRIPKKLEPCHRAEFALLFRMIHQKAGFFVLLRWRLVSVKIIGRKINFVENFTAEPTTYFFVIILNLFFTPFLEIEIKKNPKKLVKDFNR